MYLFRKATIQDLPAVYELKQSAVQRPYPGMSWSAAYPSEEIFCSDIESGSLYLLLSESGQLLGAVSINETYDKNYLSVKWETPEPALYMHRLFIDSCRRGERLGETVVAFAEKEARDRGFQSIRFDSHTSNLPAHRLYARCGYVCRGEIPLEGKTGRFFAFEKTL